MGNMTAQKKGFKMSFNQNLAVSILSLFSFCSHAGDWCEVKDPSIISDAILKAARAGVEPVVDSESSRDSRVLLKDLGNVCNDKRWVEQLTDIGRATVSLSNFNYSNGPGALTYGTGVVIKTIRCNGHFVLTAEHVVRKTPRKNADGKFDLFDSMVDPKGATMTVTTGLVDGNLAHFTGKVVAVGKVDNAKKVTHNWAVIKLPISHPNVAEIALAKGEEYKNLPLAAMGQSFDLGNERKLLPTSRLLSVDPSCKADFVGKSGEVIGTNCWVSSGASGGPLIANISGDPNKVVLRVVGNAEIASKTPSHKKIAGSEDIAIGEMTANNFEVSSDQLARAIQQEIEKNGCN